MAAEPPDSGGADAEGVGLRVDFDDVFGEFRLFGADLLRFAKEGRFLEILFNEMTRPKWFCLSRIRAL